MRTRIKKLIIVTVLENHLAMISGSKTTNRRHLVDIPLRTDCSKVHCPALDLCICPHILQEEVCLMAEPEMDLNQSLLSVLRELYKRGGRKSLSNRGDGRHQSKKI